MDDRRFDDMAKQLAQGGTRRRFLRTMLGTMLGGAATVPAMATNTRAAPSPRAARCGWQGCHDQARATYDAAVAECENLTQACAENCNPYECAGCFAWGATCRQEARSAWIAARQECNRTAVDCTPCEECVNGACVPKACANSCDECNPHTGRCEPRACGPCEICINGTCESECIGCSTCFEGQCTSSCPSCTECVGDSCVPKECPACYVCHSNECILRADAEDPGSCGPGEIYNTASCQCEGCSSDRQCTDGCCPEDSYCCEGRCLLLGEYCCPVNQNPCPVGDGYHICCDGDCCDGGCLEPGEPCCDYYGGEEACGSACCAPGEDCCADGCLDVQSDRNNCGGCGVTCGACQDCSQGTCVARQCGGCAHCDPAIDACVDRCPGTCQTCDEATQTCRNPILAPPNCELCVDGEIVIGTPCTYNCCFGEFICTNDLCCEPGRKGCCGIACYAEEDVCPCD